MVVATSFSFPLLDNKVTAGGTGAEELAMSSLVAGGTGQYPLVCGTSTPSKLQDSGGC